MPNLYHPSGNIDPRLARPSVSHPRKHSGKHVRGLIAIYLASRHQVAQMRTHFSLRAFRITGTQASSTALLSESSPPAEPLHRAPHTLVFPSRLPPPPFHPPPTPLSTLLPIDCARREDCTVTLGPLASVLRLK